MVIIDLPSNALRLPPSTASGSHQKRNNGGINKNAGLPMAAIQDILAKQFSGLNGASIPAPPRPLLTTPALQHQGPGARNNNRWTPMPTTVNHNKPRPQNGGANHNYGRTQNPQSFPMMPRPTHNKPRPGQRQRHRRVNSINQQLPSYQKRNRDLSSPANNLRKNNGRNGPTGNKPRFSSPMLPFRTVASMPRGQLQRPDNSNQRGPNGQEGNFFVPEELFNQILSELSELPQMANGGGNQFNAAPQRPPAFLPREPIFDKVRLMN